MKLSKRLLGLFIIVLCSYSCSSSEDNVASDVHVPFVKTAVLTLAGDNMLTLSGIVRARHTTPIAFQVSGRILARRVDAGQVVYAGQALFELDPRDLDQGVQFAQANVAAAKVALTTSRNDLKRTTRMRADNLTSAQALDLAELNEQETHTRLSAAKAKLAQAQNGLAYARLEAPAAGVLTEVTGQQGQVVITGQSVAILAHEGAREIELFFPAVANPPATGNLLGVNGSIPLDLREVSGAVDPQSRTWRARYSVTEKSQDLALGSIVRAEFIMAADEALTFKVPITALDERGEGPRVWQIIDGYAQPIPIKVLTLDTEFAKIQGELTQGNKVISLGTHLLSPNMAVRELTQ